jgi:hypothetical protein
MATCIAINLIQKSSGNISLDRKIIHGRLHGHKFSRPTIVSTKENVQGMGDYSNKSLFRGFVVFLGFPMV